MNTLTSFNDESRAAASDPYDRLFDAHKDLTEVQRPYNPRLPSELQDAIDRAEEMIRPLVLDGGANLPHKPLADAASALDTAVGEHPRAYEAATLSRIAADLRLGHAEITALHQEFITDNLRRALEELVYLTAILNSTAGPNAAHVSSILASVASTERAIRTTVHATYTEARIHLTSALANARVTAKAVIRTCGRSAAAAVAASFRVTEAVENARWACKFLEGSAQRIVTTTHGLDDHRQQTPFAAPPLDSGGAQMGKASTEPEMINRTPAAGVPVGQPSVTNSAPQPPDGDISSALTELERQPGSEEVARTLIAACQQFERAAYAIDSRQDLSPGSESTELHACRHERSSLLHRASSRTPNVESSVEATHPPAQAFQ